MDNYTGGALERLVSAVREFYLSIIAKDRESGRNADGNPFKLDVLPDQTSIERGGTLCGYVLIRGGRLGEVVRDLSVSVFETKDDDRLVERVSVELTTNIVIGRKPEIPVPFRIQLPIDLDVSQNEDGIGRLNGGCGLVASASCRGIRFEDSVRIQVCSDAATNSLLLAMQSHGFVPIGQLKCLQVEGQFGIITRWFKASPLSPKVYRAALQIEVRNSKVHGELTLEPSWKRFSERQQPEKLNFNIDYPDPVQDGNPRLAVWAKQVLEDLLEGSLLLGNSPANRLLRSSSMDSADALLHPVSIFPIENEHLLKPVQLLDGTDKLDGSNGAENSGS